MTQWQEQITKSKLTENFFWHCLKTQGHIERTDPLSDIVVYFPHYAMHAKQTKKKGYKQDPKTFASFSGRKTAARETDQGSEKRGEERKVINLSKGEKPSWEEGVKCKDTTRLYDGEQNTAAKSGSLVFFVLGWLV